MKAKVIKRFKDKNTKSILEIGQILEITTERFEEINSTVHGLLVEEIKEEKNLSLTGETDEDEKEIIKEEKKKKSTKKK